MPEELLTYRSSGVDVNANNESNERIKEIVLKTHDRRVITKPGLFAGAVSLLNLKNYNKPHLVGSLGFAETGTNSPEDSISDYLKAMCSQVFQNAETRLPSMSELEFIAFLDYVASSCLDPVHVEEIVRQFAVHCSRPPGIPIVGGETAELPGVFQKGAWEIVAAIFCGAEADNLKGVRCDADLSKIKRYTHPALVISIDSVGTKTKIGVLMNNTGGLALDIINHSSNDILCQGAEGIALMMYIGCHKRVHSVIQSIIDEAEKHCKVAGLSMLDIVVSEKPNAYQPGEIDVCAAVAGLIDLTDTERIVDGSGTQEGDIILGLLSFGLHTNGYSLARKALLDKGGLSLDTYTDELGTTVGQALLIPHKGYARTVLPLLRDKEICGAVKGIAHITGGGIKDNLARVLPSGLGAEIDLSQWEVPPVFKLIREKGNIPDHDPVGKGMFETFNMGMGMLLVVSAARAMDVVERLNKSGEQALPIGVVKDVKDVGIEMVRFV